jgi:nitrate reductase beta subunit
MHIRAQIATVFHLDKCIGCHTCSIACKNIWTDRAGAEYMWWNNVETKPGTGYPGRWEDQENFRGGWHITPERDIRLRSQSRAGGLVKLFYQPHQPTMDNYYEPWTYHYEHLFNAPAGDDQPTARPISQITGQPIEVKSGPNWDDDLSGSPLYAASDVNYDQLSPTERQQLFEIERIAMFYLPRICNHCLNPSCVAACPSGAIYKRGEDGIVLIQQERCRGWRACVVACPYKKIYYNWHSGKSEKCILCFPRLETGQPSACYHSCVGRIRYQGVLLYDRDRLSEAFRAPDAMLVEAQRRVILDPFDSEVLSAARASGIAEHVLDAARKSPVYPYVARWQLALPLHSEYRTMPMLYYVPPLLPVMGNLAGGAYESAGRGTFAGLEQARISIAYLARLFGAGNPEPVTLALKKLMVLRALKRNQAVPQVAPAILAKQLQEVGLTPLDAEEIHRLTTLATANERYVLPSFQREQMIEAGGDVAECKGCTGLGLLQGMKERRL